MPGGPEGIVRRREKCEKFSLDVDLLVISLTHRLKHTAETEHRNSSELKVCGGVCGYSATECRA